METTVPDSSFGDAHPSDLLGPEDSELDSLHLAHWRLAVRCVDRHFHFTACICKSTMPLNKHLKFNASVVDPDPYVVRSLESGPLLFVRARILTTTSKQRKKNLDCNNLLKTDVNVPSKSIKQKKIRKKPYLWRHLVSH